MTGRLLAVVLLLLGAACAQIPLGSNDVVRLRVRIAFGDHMPCDSSTQVVLTGGMGLARAEGSVDAECRAEFLDVPPGRYRVSVRGAGATNADAGDVKVGSVVTQDVEVRARHTDVSDATHWAAASSLVSLTDLSMPSNAAREFEKANRLISKKRWEKAIVRLQKGLSIYPRYAGGYNNLGAAYSHLGNNSGARRALQKAIELDEHLAPAYVNLGRVSFLENDFPIAEALLTKARSLSPATNADELFLLAYAQLKDKHLNKAIETSKEAHTRQLSGHASLHIAAANAYEQQEKTPELMAELELYLREDPNGPQVEKVRTALGILKARFTQH